MTFWKKTIIASCVCQYSVNNLRAESDACATQYEFSFCKRQNYDFCISQGIDSTSKVPDRAGYFASEMNARKSLGGVIRSTCTYAVVITCRGRHWSNCQREPVWHRHAYVAETTKLPTEKRKQRRTFRNRCRSVAGHSVRCRRASRRFFGAVTGTAA